MIVIYGDLMFESEKFVHAQIVPTASAPGVRWTVRFKLVEDYMCFEFDSHEVATKWRDGLADAINKAKQPIGFEKTERG